MEEENKSVNTEATTDAISDASRMQAQTWLYNPYGINQYPTGYGIGPHNYGLHYYQYYSQVGYGPYMSFNSNKKDNLEKRVEDNTIDKKPDPPLPPGPPPPISSNAVISKPPVFNNLKPFGNIRFSFNNKRVNDHPPTTNSLTSGAAKKKRKRNKNNQNLLQQNCTQMPPLPPPEKQMPKPAPPPETMPPLPPIPPINLSVPPPPLPKQPPAHPVVRPQPNSFNNPTDEWPQELKDYVNRCYAKCKTNIDKDQVDIVLKGKITQAASSGELWVKDWLKEPLPSIHSERMTLVPKTMPDQLAQFQNPPKKGLSAAMGARLGARASTMRSRDSRSSSSSPSRSPYRYKKSASRSPHRRKSSSKSSSPSSEHYKVSKKGNLVDRLGPSKNKVVQKQSKKAKVKDKKSYVEFNGMFAQNSEILQQRAARFNSVGKVDVTLSGLNGNEKKKKTMLNNSFTNKFVEDTTPDFDWTEFHIVGICQDIEKSYLRLTKAPEACEVRPVEVLKLSLQNVKSRWMGKHEYFYACDQLKSIRQDLTVQGVRNDFTVEVYETHARIALEKGDREEFNQCQTQLKMLYSEIGGLHRNEFVAYRLLYYIFTNNTLDILTMMKCLTVEERKDNMIAFALKLRSAWGLGDFHRFFRLYQLAPCMTGYLIDWFAERERINYLKAILKSYRPNISVSHVTEELAFNNQEECLNFLNSFGLTFTDGNRTLIDCKASMAVIHTI